MNSPDRPDGGPGKGDDPLEPPKEPVVAAGDLSVELGGLPVLRGITVSVLSLIHI